MEPNSSIVKKYILPALIGAFALLLCTVISTYFQKGDGKLSTREITETRTTDGTVTKRRVETFK